MLLSCLPVSPPSESKNSYRVARDQTFQQGVIDTANPSASRTQRLPLNGQIEVQEEAPLVDPKQFAGTPVSPLNGNARERGPLQSGLDNFNMQPVNAGADRMMFNPTVATTRLRGDLSDQELRQLATHDIVIMQDRSSSMGEKDYFPMAQEKISKWKWCMSQSMDLTRQTTRLPKFGITLVVFSSQYDVYQNVRLQQMPSIIANSRNGLFIGTKLAAPMHDQLTQYFQRRAMGKARPLIIAVITDGKPQDDHELRDVIIQATQLMRNPNEIKIKFLQIGNDDEGEKKLNKLDTRLVSKGARFDIVGVEPFTQLAQEGLPRALLRAIRG